MCRQRRGTALTRQASVQSAGGHHHCRRRSSRGGTRAAQGSMLQHLAEAMLADCWMR